MSAGMFCRNSRAAQTVKGTEAATARRDVTSPSVRSWRTICPRPAPRAMRRAISRPRSAPRASMRLATSMQAMSRTRPAATCQRASSDRSAMSS